MARTNSEWVLCLTTTVKFPTSARGSDDDRQRKNAKKRDICSKTTEHFLPSEKIWALLKVQADDETAQWTQDIVWCSSKLINEFRLSKLSFSMNKPLSKTD